MNPIDYGHDLQKLLKDVRKLTHLKFDMPSSVEAFLIRLCHLGENRYLSADTYVRPQNLVDLDESVWNIRAYCRFVHVTVAKDGAEIDLMDHYVVNINSRISLKDPRRFEPYQNHGFLVDVLKRSRSDSLRCNLVWYNRFSAADMHESRIRRTGRPREFLRIGSELSPRKKEKKELSRFIHFPTKRTDVFLTE